MERFAHAFASLSLVAALSTPHAVAQSWPQAGPVTIISSNTPGGAPDIVARMVAEGLEEAFKQRFLVDNKPGGNSIIATMAAVRARPDGYTLCLPGNSIMAANPTLMKSPPYDPERDLTPIAMVVDSSPLMLAVNARVPAGSVQELVALAKAQPGKLTIGVSGTLAPIIAELLNKSAGVNVRLVRYKLSSLSANDVAAGTVSAVLISVTGIASSMDEGRVRPLAVVARHRFPLMSDVPALEESFKGISIEGWQMLVGPAGLPQDIARRIAQALDPYLKRPDTQKRLHVLGLTSAGAQTPEWARDFVRSERERWVKVAAELGLKPQ